MKHRSLALALMLALGLHPLARAEPPEAVESSGRGSPPLPAPGDAGTPPGEAGRLAVQPAEESSSAAGDRDPLPLEELRAFTEVYAKIKSDYVERVSDKQLLADAIKGMLAGLDPHSSYLDADAFKGLQEGTSGEFGGVGMEVGSVDGLIRVISPVDDTPAARAGIQPGDLILKIDETPTKDMSLNDAVKLLRGAPGSPVRLTIGREGSDKPLQVTLERAVIRTRSVRNEMLEAGFAYVRIASFQNHTGEDFRRTLEELQKASAGRVKGMVLDLRNNPGGVLNAAVEVSDHLLESGRIVYTDGRVLDSTLQFDAKPGDLLAGAPVVVLINGGSASASEIVAGALQDHRRAVIMGTQSFGKGSVQTILPMQSQAALKLTTARYYTPSGRSIQAQGIAPDITLDGLVISEAPEDAGGGLQFKEADLRGRLDNPNGNGNGNGAVSEGAGSDAGGEPAKKETTPAVATPASKLPREDYAINEALNLLKGMALLREPLKSPPATESAKTAGR
jgi:carboxyl-terminal processing protease